MAALAGSPEQSELARHVADTMAALTKIYDRGYFLTCWREQRFEAELWSRMGELGLFSVGVPEEQGGMGGGLAGMVQVLDGLSSAGLPTMLYSLTCFSRTPILRHGTPEQIERFVKPTMSGEKKIAFAITEPDAGTNTFRIATKATPHKGGWRLNGAKVFTSAANHAELMMVIARTRPYTPGASRREGISVFVIDTNHPGVQMTPLNIELYSPEQQFQVFFNDVDVGPEALIGPEGQGMETMFDALNPERLLSAVLCIGVGDFALAKTIDYVKQRAPFGRPIGAYQGVQHPMARAKAHLDAARLMTYYSAHAFDAGGNVAATANMAKYLGAQASVEAVDAAIQFHGGYGFDADYDVITLWPIVRLFKVAPLNDEMILNYIGEHVLGLPKSY
ncbi:MAG: acyl-CoA/acyl-ACP dehydrogenase [Candidatus Lambdaproteobacteria bacterium]|nr:acyl-CoA/acyl-ACP dehydrogenase [Candidatus Lambdaproteobacteria bacterium]